MNPFFCVRCAGIIHQNNLSMAESDTFAVYVEKELIGRRIKSSKVRVTWQFAFAQDGILRNVQLKHSIVSGKREVYVEGMLLFASQKVFQGNFKHAFTLPEHHLRVTIEDTFEGFLYDLLIDGLPFHKLPRKSMTEVDMFRQSLEVENHEFDDFVGKKSKKKSKSKKKEGKTKKKSKAKPSKKKSFDPFGSEDANAGGDFADFDAAFPSGDNTTPQQETFDPFGSNAGSAVTSPPQTAQAEGTFDPFGNAPAQASSASFDVSKGLEGLNFDAIGAPAPATPPSSDMLFSNNSMGMQNNGNGFQQDAFSQQTAPHSIESRLVDLDNLMSPGNPFASTQPTTNIAPVNRRLSGSNSVRTLSGGSPQTAMNQMPGFQKRQNNPMGGSPGFASNPFGQQQTQQPNMFF